MYILVAKQISSRSQTLNYILRVAVTLLCGKLKKKGQITALSGSLKAVYGNTIARINVSEVRLCNVLRCRYAPVYHFGKGFGKHRGLAKNATITFGDAASSCEK